MPTDTPEPTPEPTVTPEPTPQFADLTDNDWGIVCTINRRLIGINEKATITVTTRKLANRTEQSKPAMVWSSSDASVVRVDSKSGTVTGISAGRATITGYAEDNPDVNTSVEIEVIKRVSELKLVSRQITLLVGGAPDRAVGKVEPIIAPADATVPGCQFKSDNEKCVTVDSQGNLTAHAAGKATVTVTLKEGGTKVKAEKCIVTVGKSIEKITVKTPLEIELKRNVVTTEKLNPVIEPADAWAIKNSDPPPIYYESSNPDAVEVHRTNGTITAKACGQATITCTATDGSGVVARCEVTVYKRVEAVRIPGDRIILFEGMTKTLPVTVEAADATNKKLNYTVSGSNADQDKIISVDEHGNITALKAGTVKLRAETTDGSNIKTFYITVYVKPRMPVVISSIAVDEVNDLLQLEIANKCTIQTNIVADHTMVANVYFDVACYDMNRNLLSRPASGTYSLDNDFAMREGAEMPHIGLRPKEKVTVYKKMPGIKEAYRIVIRLTRVRFEDGTWYDVPDDDEAAVIEWYKY